MTAPSRQVLSIDGYVHQVERACADLPEPVRQRIVTDLKAHLQELPNPEDPLAALGSPVDYARDLRAAMGLPEAATRQVSQPRQWRPWVVVLGGLAALAVMVIVVAMLFHGSGSSSAVLAPTPTSAATRPAHVSVPRAAPSLVGKSVERAVSIAVAHGVQVTRIDKVHSRQRSGTVVSQRPAAGRRVDPRVGITVHVAR